MRQHFLKMLTASILTLSLVSACTSAPTATPEGTPKETSKEPTKSAAPNGTTDKVKPPGTFPIVDKKETLKIFTIQDSTVENPATNDFVKWYEEKTNIKIEWDVAPAAGFAEKLQVTLAGGKLPDIFMASNISASQQVSYGAQGVFRPLNDLIDKYAPNIKKMMQDSPYLKDYMYTLDGNIYALPTLDEGLHVTLPNKLWIYQPWLDKLGLKMPTTLDEYYNVLVAFKKNYPNAWPLSALKGAEPTNFFMQSFIYYDNRNYLQMKDKKVEFVADKPAYKEGLKYLRKLVKDGLLQPEAYTQDRQALTALGEYPNETRLGSVTGLWWGSWVVHNGESGRYKDYQPVGILAGPNGERIGMDRGVTPQMGAFAITKDAKNPEAAIRWVDWLYNPYNMFEEGWSAYFGKEGVGWKKAAPGAKSYTGADAKWEFIMPYGTKNNHRLQQSAPFYRTAAFTYSEAMADKNDLEPRLYRATNELYVPYSRRDLKVPFLFLSEKDLTKHGDLLNNIKNVVSQFEIKFLTGNLDLDKDWDSYLKELNNAGLPAYIEIVQRNVDLKK